MQAHHPTNSLGLKAPSDPDSFPTFHPHLTLFSIPPTVSLEDALNVIPSDQSTIPIRFGALEDGETYTKAIYLTLRDSDESDSSLSVLRRHIASMIPTLHSKTTMPPVPHVSLSYVSTEDLDLRTLVAEEMRRKIRNDEDGGISLHCEKAGAADSNHWLGGFEGSEIWAVLIVESVENWEVRQKVPLKRI